MSINTIHDKAAPAAPKTTTYPMLMVADDGDVVLFQSNGYGTRVASPNHNRDIAYNSSHWNMAYFKPLPEGETITLSNAWETADE